MIEMMKITPNVLETPDLLSTTIKAFFYSINHKSYKYNVQLAVKWSEHIHAPQRINSFELKKNPSASSDLLKTQTLYIKGQVFI